MAVATVMIRVLSGQQTLRRDWYGSGPTPWLGGARPSARSLHVSAEDVAEIDWVSKGAVTTPISQGRCGTCAQFSATANIEAAWKLAGNELTPLAVQDMIDCSRFSIYLIQFIEYLCPMFPSIICDGC